MFDFCESHIGSVKMLLSAIKFICVSMCNPCVCHHCKLIWVDEFNMVKQYDQIVKKSHVDL